MDYVIPNATSDIQVSSWTDAARSMDVIDSYRAAEIYRYFSSVCANLYSDSHFYPSLQEAERRRALRFLQELGDLPDNWDGEGAADIADDILSRSAKILMEINQLPTDIVPHPAGTVMLEWETWLGRAYIEIGSSRYNIYVKPRYARPRALVGDVTQLDGPSALVDFLEAVSSATEFPSAPPELTRLTYGV
ncbi:hypothetical protein V0R37_18630 [Pollutimonas sp. H1-120]|uniref:hypothetical protein n=1 Tax=Pollutimonas sp. H1-120 TaxID=3148824 RepID=UPI003B51BA1E